MEIPENIKTIEIYYDGRCGMCCTFHEWINVQERAYAIDFIAYQADRAEEIFPGITELNPAAEMIVRTDQGEVFRGAKAWVLCLNSCVKYQKVALRLSGPMLLPIAIKACNLLAGNRHALSKVFFRKKDKEVAAELHAMEEIGCKGGTCQHDA